jgi:hypothetical protein
MFVRTLATLLVLAAGSVLAVPEPGRAATGSARSGGPAATPPFRLSCPSPSLCVAGDGAGHILVSTNPAGRWRAAIGGQAHAIHGVSCPSSALCVAVDGAGGEWVSRYRLPQ